MFLKVTVYLIQGLSLTTESLLSFQKYVSKEELRGKPWYYGPISRDDCVKLMTERGQEGDFMVRDSESNVSQIILVLQFSI